MHSQGYKYNSIKVSLWKYKSFTYERNYSLIQDMMISLFFRKLGITDYNESSNIRTNQKDGGVSILIKDCFEIKILDISVKDTLVTNVLLYRNKFLLIISSYFPCSNKITK